METSTMPVPEKAPWQTEGREKRESVRQMFAEIAPRYDLLNSLMSFSRHRRWRAFAVSKLNLDPGDCVLDLCSGTGDFMEPLRQAVGPGGRVLGIDFCLPMLQIAKRKDAPGALALGDALRIPVRDSSVEAVTVGWGIRNVPDIDAAHREIFRTLRLGGRFVSVDMALPRNRVLARLSGFTLNRLLPLLGSLFGQRKAYTYLPKSTAIFLGREALQQSMEAAGFQQVGYRDFMFGNICVHWGSRL